MTGARDTEHLYDTEEICLRCGLSIDSLDAAQSPCPGRWPGTMSEFMLRQEDAAARRNYRVTDLTRDQ